MPFQTEKPYTFDRVVRIMISLLTVALIIWLLSVLREVLVPFAIAILAAYLINPLTLFVQRNFKIKRRWLSILISFFIITVVFMALSSVVSPMIKKEVSEMSNLLEKYASDTRIEEKIGTMLPSDLADQVTEFLKSDDVKSWLGSLDWKSLVDQIGTGIGGIYSGSMALIGAVVSLFLIIIYLIFILIDYENLQGGWRNWLPEKYKSSISTLVADLEAGMNKYFRAQALIATIIGILFAIGFSMISLPLGIIFGLFVGFLNLVPYLQTFAIIPAGFLALLYSLETGDSFWIYFGWIVLIFVIIQVIQETVLVPKIMGDVTGLNPAIILLSLSIWGQLLGLLGLIIALPVTTLLLSYYRRFLNKTKATVT